MSGPLTTPFTGTGTTLGYKLSGGSTFTPLGTLNDDFSFGGISVNVIPTSYLATTVATKSPGRVDSGDVSGTVALIPSDTTVQELRTLIYSRAYAIWQVMLPDGSSATTGSTAVFSGFLSNYAEKGFSGESEVVADFTITISGAVTFTIGT